MRPPALPNAELLLRGNVSRNLIIKAQFLVVLSEHVQQNITVYIKMVGPSCATARMDELRFQIEEIFDPAVFLADTDDHSHIIQHFQRKKPDQWPGFQNNDRYLQAYLASCGK